MASQTPRFGFVANRSLNPNLTGPCRPRGAANMTGCGGGHCPRLACPHHEPRGHDGGGDGGDACDGGDRAHHDAEGPA